MLIRFPLVKNVIAFLRTTDCIEHIAVTLTVHTFLKSLDVQAKIYFVGRDVFADSGQIVALQGIQKYQETQDFVVSSPFGFIQQGIIFRILSESRNCS